MSAVNFVTPNAGLPPWTTGPYEALTSQNIIIPIKDTNSGDYKLLELGINSTWYTDPAGETDKVHWSIAYGDTGYLYLCVMVDDYIRVGATWYETTWKQDGTLDEAQHAIASIYTGTLEPGFWYYWDVINSDSQNINYPVSEASLSAQNVWNQYSTFAPLATVPVGTGMVPAAGATPGSGVIVVDIPNFEISMNGVVVSDYQYGDTSGPGGGSGGSFDKSSDTIGIPSLPTGGAAATGMITMFAPTEAQLQSFGQFLWTTLFNPSVDSLLTSLKKWVNDPIESVVQLAAYPVTPPAGAAQIVKFCGIASDIVGAGVSMNKCSSQFMSFDFGSLSTPAYWKQCLDYSPYTQVSIYLPYIGIVPLKADDVIDATLHLVYNIDLLTGAFSACLEVKKNIDGTSLSSVLYNWSGNMAVQIPITAGNFSNVFGAIATAVAAVGVGAITGGLGAAAAGGESVTAAAAGGALSGAGHGLAANIGNVINAKPHVQQGGRLDSAIGALAVPSAYLIIERPVQSLSNKYQEEQGYPSNTVQTLKNLTGMTVCEAPIMDGFSGVNDDELREIKSILCSGVIL